MYSKKYSRLSAEKFNLRISVSYRRFWGTVCNRLISDHKGRTLGCPKVLEITGLLSVVAFLLCASYFNTWEEYSNGQLIFLKFPALLLKFVLSYFNDVWIVLICTRKNLLSDFWSLFSGTLRYCRATRDWSSCSSVLTLLVAVDVGTVALPYRKQPFHCPILLQ